MLLRYRGREGMYGWLFHRISGIAIWAFVILHVIDIYLVGGNPDAYDELLAIYASTVGRILEVLLGAALLYHALNGLRIVVMDFWPSLTRFHRALWWAVWVPFLLVGVPVAYQILAPIFGLPQFEVGGPR